MQRAQRRPRVHEGTDRMPAETAPDKRAPSRTFQGDSSLPAGVGDRQVHRDPSGTKVQRQPSSEQRVGAQEELPGDLRAGFAGSNDRATVEEPPSQHLDRRDADGVGLDLAEDRARPLPVEVLEPGGESVRDDGAGRAGVHERPERGPSETGEHVRVSAADPETTAFGIAHVRPSGRIGCAGCALLPEVRTEVDADRHDRGIGTIGRAERRSPLHDRVSVGARPVRRGRSVRISDQVEPVQGG
jgi:hypothetical protein